RYTLCPSISPIFPFHAPAFTETYTLSLHDALPILVASFRATLEEVRGADLLLHVVDASHPGWEEQMRVVDEVLAEVGVGELPLRSEEHTSELQSRENLVCRLLLEKKKTRIEKVSLH